MILLAAVQEESAFVTNILAICPAAPINTPPIKTGATSAIRLCAKAI